MLRCGRLLFMVNSFNKNQVTRSMASMKTKQAVVRCVEQDERLSLSFIYGNSELGIGDRKYNFCRRRDEPLEKVKGRIATSIEGVVKKKLTKKQRKNQQKQQSGEASSEEFILDVDIRSADGTTINDGIACENAFINGSMMSVNGISYTVVVNPPTVISVSLPKVIMVGFPVHPIVNVEFIDVKACRFIWFKRTGSQTWQRICEESQFTPVVADIGWKIKVRCEPIEMDGENEITAKESENLVEVNAGPGLCPFDTRHRFTDCKTKNGRYVSYNILADLYADSDFSRETLFPYCPTYALDIDYRKQLIIKELKGYNADIICLQEVDAKVFDGCLQPLLETEGFTGIFRLKGGKVAEGLACFFNREKFSLVDAHSLIIADVIQTDALFADILAAAKTNEKLDERLLRRTTALQVVILQSKEDPNRCLCLGNTHLYFHPDADHIRLLQAGVCLRHLEKIVTIEKSKNPETKISPILSGDFNSTPEFGVYQLATTQFIPEDHADWSSNESEAVKSVSLSHSFELESACGTPPYTNFTLGFAGCLDYIFVDVNNLKIEQVVPLPSDDELREHQAIPSVTSPSDHIALVCDLSWK